MNSASHNLNPTVLIDREAMESMRTIDMLCRIQQMQATGRYSDVHVDYELGLIVADVIA